MQDAPIDDRLIPLAERLQAVRDLVDLISREVGSRSPRSAEPIIARHRPRVYAVMDELGRAVAEFLQTGPRDEELEAARELVVKKLREWSATSPVFFRSWRGPRRRYDYFELVEHVRSKGAAGADVPSMVFHDYYIHSVSSEAFRNRLTLFQRILHEEVGRRHEAGDHPLRIFSLQFVGGRELVSLSTQPELQGRLQITCLDMSAAAVRQAQQTCDRWFTPNVQYVKADPERWLHGPACPRDSASVAYAVSLLEQRDDESVVRILRGVYGLLREGGSFIAGSVTPAVPVAEQMLREWMLDWNWRYRDEEEWRRLFGQTPFGAEAPTFEREPLGANLLVCARR